MGRQRSNLVGMVAVAGVVLIVAGRYLWPEFGPLFSDYQLTSGSVACATKEEVVKMRGAKLFGSVAAAGVFSNSDCVLGPLDVAIKDWAAHGDLVHKVEIDGRVMYVDKGGLKKQ